MKIQELKLNSQLAELLAMNIDELKSRISKTNNNQELRTPTGSCYEYACRLLLGRGMAHPTFGNLQDECGDIDFTNATLVHGRPSGNQYENGHAWVEVDDLVIDATVTPCYITSKESYYERGGIDEADSERYTSDEAFDALCKFQHWGDWR
jgi:hypothetical protein